LSKFGFDQTEVLNKELGRSNLIKDISLDLKLRKVSGKDKQLLFKWANEEGTRKNALNPKEILWEEHVTWFDAKIKSENTLLYIFEFENIPVGQIRYDRKENNIWDMDYSIAKEFRGKGYGKKMVMLSLKKVPGIIRAIVKTENFPSKKVLEQIGFQMEKQDAKILQYIYR
jgi:RimJ/RimL family protein N-acetyltransferase